MRVERLPGLSEFKIMFIESKRPFQRFEIIIFVKTLSFVWVHSIKRRGLWSIQESKLLPWGVVLRLSVKIVNHVAQVLIHFRLQKLKLYLVDFYHVSEEIALGLPQVYRGVKITRNNIFKSWLLFHFLFWKIIYSKFQ